MTGKLHYPIGRVRSWLSLAIIIILYVLSFVDRQIIALMVGPIKHDLGLSDMQIGLLQGLAFSVTYGLAGLPIGWAVDRYSRRIIIFLGVIGWSLAAAATGLARNFTQLFLARSAVGIGEATLAPAGLSLIGDIFPRERLATALSFYTTGSNLGGGIALALGGVVVGSLMATPLLTVPILGTIASWQAVFMVIGLPGLLFAFLALALKEPRRPRATADMTTGAAWGQESFFAVLRQRGPVLAAHWTAFPLVALVAYSMSLWVPSWAMRTYGWSPRDIGLVMGFSHGVIAFGTTLAGGFLTDFAFRRGMRDAHFRIPAITCGLGGAICVFGFVAIPSGNIAVWTVALGATIQSAFGGAAFSSLQLIVPSKVRGRITSVYVLILTLIGLGVGPVLIGYVSDVVSPDGHGLGIALALVMGGATILAVVIFIAGRPALRRALADAERDLAAQDAV